MELKRCPDIQNHAHTQVHKRSFGPTNEKRGRERDKERGREFNSLKSDLGRSVANYLRDIMIYTPHFMEFSKS